MAETMIPLFPCHELDETLDFYKAIGFEVTFHQKSPYQYGVVERGDMQFQFFRMKGYDPKASISACYVITDDVDALHASFRAGLKQTLGRIPTRGLPRIGALKDMSYGVRQFLMTDPAGNNVRVGQPIADSFAHSAVPKERYARALHQAVLLGESKEDPSAAARIIDHALAADGTPTPVQLVKLYVVRAEMAEQLGEPERPAEWLDRAAAVRLTEEERQAAADELLRAEDLRGSL
ncbi:bleomycin resistance protein [Streptomyces sp. NPDC051218]|uniref:bleomycin resistance protein n=1 Tax=Streptomyces sp. NPDC051218 TaxID=3365645 RepID=UPI0037916797